jgi:hypothetical protein
MQSMQSEQTKAFQDMIAKQDKQARRQAKVQPKATEAAVRTNENMMTMVVELIRELRIGKQGTKQKEEKANYKEKADEH